MTDYSTFARAYSEANENNLLNAWYERPAGETWPTRAMLVLDDAVRRAPAVQVQVINA